MVKTKKYIPFLFCLILFLSGCSVKNDIKKDTDAVTTDNTPPKITDPRLELLEELFDNMDYDKVILKYKDNVPASATITRFRYYVIFSDLDENTTYNLIDKDIRHTSDAMRKHYVSVLPDSVTPVFLFKDYDTYKNFSINTFGLEPDDLSPYGFYKISKNVIVIRYVSWKGSTSHEITHSFTRYDFPRMPSWFDEGLASLHEKYIYTDESMKGSFNWRILALRRAFRENTYTGIKTMMETNDIELYGKRSSFYYAQSRYLLMYIQQTDLLDDYYKLFRDTYDEDKTGITQLEKTMNKSIEEIDKELIEYINSFTQERY
jgi:hypothetical protein